MILADKSLKIVSVDWAKESSTNALRNRMLLDFSSHSEGFLAPLDIERIDLAQPTTPLVSVQVDASAIIALTAQELPPTTTTLGGGDARLHPPMNRSEEPIYALRVSTSRTRIEDRIWPTSARVHSPGTLQIYAINLWAQVFDENGPENQVWSVYGSSRSPVTSLGELDHALNTTSSPVGEPWPSIKYSRDVVMPFSSHQGLIIEVLGLGVKIATAVGVRVGEVHMTQFVSIEDPDYIGYILSWYCEGTDKHLFELSPTMAEAVGEWGRYQEDRFQTQVASLLTTEILPVRMLRDDQA